MAHYTVSAERMVTVEADSKEEARSQATKEFQEMAENEPKELMLRAVNVYLEE